MVTFCLSSPIPQRWTNPYVNRKNNLSMSLRLWEWQNFLVQVVRHTTTTMMFDSLAMVVIDMNDVPLVPILRKVPCNDHDNLYSVQQSL